MFSGKDSQNPTQDGAFTLLELLVVLGMISLLIGLLGPALSGARDQARTVKGLAHLSQIGRAIYAYTLDYENMLPVGYLEFNNGQDTNWTTLLHGFLTASGMTDATLDRGGFLDVFMDPNSRVGRGRVHYSAHPILMPDLSPERPIKTTYSISRIRRSTEIVLVMDGTQDPAQQFNAHATAWQLDGGAIWAKWQYDAADPDNANPIDPGPNEDTSAAAGHIRWRQVGQSANFLYADGHAATRIPTQITKASVHVD